MPVTVSNKNFQLQIDTPLEGYKFSRFDWTGKITSVVFQNIELCGTENFMNDSERDGQGFYNEFGIDKPIGFEETEIGGWFHKIGIGLLQKDSNQYDFLKSYKIQPNKFNHTISQKELEISTKSKVVNGYGYHLIKRVELTEDGFLIFYRLHNIGDLPILTNEYNHNFISFNHGSIGKPYELRFPFDLNTESFDEVVNSENKVQFFKNQFSFNKTPLVPFFFSNLAGKRVERPSWELIHTNLKIGIRESVNIDSAKINLWGWGHVISPEIYIDINLLPGQEMSWSRNYFIYSV